MQYNPNYLNNQNYTNYYHSAKNTHLPNNIESNGLYPNNNYQQNYLMKNNYFGGDKAADEAAKNADEAAKAADKADKVDKKKL